ncbi:ATP-binding cassette domain-containing protein [Sutterella wadsworthensis]|uniref:ATP-binding cassette domain-containing protein n=1 Tax=Sutterella wadsworthensis TaxID=40545 RepID=UPI003078FE6C
MALITLIDAHLAYGDLPLLDEANISIEPGERVGLIGRNGTGKSSLLSVLAGKTMLDDGQLQRMDGLTIHYVEQEPQLPDAPTLKESLILRGKLDETTDEREKWRILAKLDENLSHFELNPNADPKLTSGGEKKRAALALAFTLAPQLLLLDEPTNHLDMRAIRLLEARSQDELKNQRSLVVITHDRAFLDKVATRIVELDRGVLRSYPGNFAAYETRKEEELAAEELERRRFDKFWAQEEVWIRKGIEARRTRNEGRVKRLEQLRRERAARRDQMGSIRMSIDAGEKSGKIVAEVKGLSKSFGDCVIVKDLDFTLMRGDRLGLIGRNGAGKSTLIKLLLGKIQPDAGTVKLGTNIKLAYFDQLREQLDLTKTVAETISPGSDWVEIGGERKHIIAYLGDFLFPPRRANVPVSSLSGGERNRLLLARLFALPANLLVLDEPTNDLDIDSLELLEQTLAVYPGTIILISHDRRFLDNVVTEVLAPEGDGKWREYVGGYTEWFTQRQQENDPFAAAKTEKKAEKTEKPAKNEKPRDVIPQKIKLSWREARELEALPEKLEAMEKEQASIINAMSAFDYHSKSVEDIKADKLRLEELEKSIADGWTRWEALSEKESLSTGK